MSTDPGPESSGSPKRLDGLEDPEAIEMSVIIPCLNEAGGVGICVAKAREAMSKMGVKGEVLVVDNGSTDDSARIATEAGARVVFERRRGYGSAYRRGFQEAKGRFFVMGDADDTYDFTDLARFLAPLKDDGVDMVIGNRFGGQMEAGAMPWSHRWIGNPVLSGMLKLLFHTRISDSHCGMRSFTREAYRKMHLRTTGMEFASEIVVNALREGLTIKELPIDYRARVGDSKLEGITDAWRHVRFMLLYSPSFLFQLPGFVLMATGGFLVVSLAGGPREMFGRVWDYHVFLFGALGLMLGFNLVLFDVFAKTFSMGVAFAKPDRWLSLLHRLFSLERGLAIGGLLFLAGLSLEAKIVYDWAQSGYGPLMAVKGMVIGATSIVIGSQTALGSFLVSLLLIERR